MHIHYSSCTSTSTSDELCHEPHFLCEFSYYFLLYKTLPTRTRKRNSRNPRIPFISDTENKIITPLASTPYKTTNPKFVTRRSPVQVWLAAH